MPTYEYMCEKCGQHFELRQKMTDKPASTCKTSECDGKPKRLISNSTSFVLLGGGWYKDGY